MAKKDFFYFCYLIRVEHEKFSEMCVWIVRFGQKLRKWDCFNLKFSEPIFNSSEQLRVLMVVIFDRKIRNG
jgi:hypothetical protein